MPEPRFFSRLLSLLLLVALAAGAGAGASWLLRPRGPVIDSVAPARARPGESVTVKGAGFGAGTVLVLFGDQTGPVVDSSASEIHATVPEAALMGSTERHVALRVLVGDRASGPADFALYRGQAPTEEAVVIVPPEQAPLAPPPTAPAARPKEPTGERPPLATSPPQPQVTLQARTTVEPAKPPAPQELPANAHTFLLERTTAQNIRHGGSAPAGFDASGVDVKRGPEVPARIDFEMTPPKVKAGDRYTVTVLFDNDGGKPIRIKELYVATTRNGVLSAGPVLPRVREVTPRQREVLGAFSDVWQQDVAAWAMDVTVTSERGDVYKSQVSWK